MARVIDCFPPHIYLPPSEPPEAEAADDAAGDAAGPFREEGLEPSSPVPSCERLLKTWRDKARVRRVLDGISMPTLLSMISARTQTVTEDGEGEG